MSKQQKLDGVGGKKGGMVKRDEAVPPSYPDITPLHRLFLQTLSASGYLSQELAEEHLSRLVRDYPFCRGGLKPQEITVESTTRTLNPGLEAFDMRIQQTRGEGDGTLYLVLCNTKADSLAKEVGAGDKVESVAVLKVIMNYLIAKKWVLPPPLLPLLPAIPWKCRLSLPHAPFLHTHARNPLPPQWQLGPFYHHQHGPRELVFPAG